MFGWWMTTLITAGFVLLIVKIVAASKHAVPWMTVSTINDIDIEFLKETGILGIVFDVDNTLTQYHLTDLDDRVVHKFQELKKNFKVAIFTNAIGEERHHQLQVLFRGLPIVNRHHRKPEQPGFIEAAKMLSLHPSTMAMIGDRPLTDVVGGNMAGMKTIRVKTLLGAPAWYNLYTWLERRVF